MSYQDYLQAPTTLPPPPSPQTSMKYLSQLQITLIFLISSCSYQAVQLIEYSRKPQTQSQEQVIQLVQLILPHRILIGLCNRDRVILLYELMFFGGQITFVRS